MYFHHVRLFLEFWNFYWCIIQNFWKLAKSFTSFTKKSNCFDRILVCQLAFDNEKKIVTKAPILIHNKHILGTIVKTNFPDHINNRVFSWVDKDRPLHSVRNFSETFNPAKFDYKIHDKKKLAIIWCFEQCRLQLVVICVLIKVITDRKSLEYLVNYKKLSRRQSC